MLNRLHIILIFIVVILSTASTHAADFCEKKTELYNRWPFTTGRVITESTDYIFYGDGDIVSVMDKNTLAPVSSIHIDVSAPLDNFPSNDQEADALRLNRLLERAILKAPEQYFWIHRRFKTRPEGAASIY